MVVQIQTYRGQIMSRICVVLMLLLLVGCSKSPYEAARAPVQEANQAEKPGGARGPAQNAPAGANAEKAIARKIVYTASVELIVTDFDNVRERVPKIAEQFEGFVGNSRMDAVAGDRRRATWTLRVPVAKFRSALAAIEQLGHIVSTNSDSQDVTEEFYDLEARLKTKQEEEKTLREILAKSAGKLEDVLTMRRELTRIREEIEAAQGRLNKLSKLSDLTTIALIVQEQKDYVPPTTPTFGSHIAMTFSDSVEALWSVLKAIAVAMVALAPWLPFILVVAGLAYLVFRWQRHATSTGRPVPAAGPSTAPHDSQPPSA